MRINTSIDSPISGILLNSERETTPSDLKPISIKIIESNDPNYTKDNPQRRCPDLSLIKKSVNYIPKIDLEEGLKRVYKWYRSNLS